MTCIVGIVHEGLVYLGGDAAGIAGTSLTHRADPKVFSKGDYVFGFTSSFRMGQLLQHSLVVPEPRADEDLAAFMSTRFVDAVRHCLKEGGYAKVKDDREVSGTFLVGYRGRLFVIDSDYQVGEPLDHYDACGAGDEIARGSLYTSVGQPPGVRLETALKAAERWCAAVRGPFLYVQTPVTPPAPVVKPKRSRKKTPPA